MKDKDKQSTKMGGKVISIILPITEIVIVVFYFIFQTIRVHDNESYDVIG